MLNSLKFGIVIALYNTEKYIIECLKSILEQNYPNLEIVIVDDGSVDSSIRLVEEFSRSNDVPIHIIESSHKGAAGARNIGISKIKDLNCDYVLFLDSDDLLKGDIFNHINDVNHSSKEQVELFLLKQRGFYTNTNLNEKFGSALDKNIDFVELLRVYFRGDGYRNSLYSAKGAANKIFSISLLDDTFFDENLLVCEDQIFFLSLIEKRNYKLSVVLLGDGVYWYRQRKASLTHSDNRRSLKLAYYSYWKLYEKSFYSYDEHGLFLKEVCWWFKNAFKSLEGLERKSFYQKEVRKLRMECLKRKNISKKTIFSFVCKTFLPYKYFAGVFKKKRMNAKDSFLFD